MDIWEKHQFKVIETQDGSPSLRWMGAEVSGVTEAMHHSGGAYTETEFIYGRPLNAGFTFIDLESVHVASVGLGLGYNELMSAQAYLEQTGRKSLNLTSFESIEFLSQSFLSFIKNEPLDPMQHNIFSQETSFYRSPELIKTTLEKLHKEKTWQILGALNTTLKLESKFNVILYDAFSSKTSPELWSENFLNYFLNNFCAEQCIFTTYACTGSLKRALKKNGFTLLVRPGFHGKRDSTVGFRNLGRGGASIDELLHVLDDRTL